MNILTLECDRDQKDLLAAELYEAGTLGLIEEDLPDSRCLLRAFFDGETALAQRFSAYGASLRQADEPDWVAAARAQWQPLSVGEQFYLVPAWRDDPAPPGRLRLEMPPGTAFGTGLHPATQLALEALERCVHPGDSVLDLGTGSGILSAGAILLGAGQVIACDIDEEAARAARGYCGRQVAIFVGSARSLRGASVDVIVANINAATISSLASEMARVLNSGGRVILSGFTSDQVPRLTQRLAVTGTLAHGEWLCFIAGKES